MGGENISGIDVVVCVAAAAAIESRPAFCTFFLGPSIRIAPSERLTDRYGGYYAENENEGFRR